MALHAHHLLIRPRAWLPMLCLLLAASVPDALHAQSQPAADAESVVAAEPTFAALVEKAIKDYVAAHPEVIVAALDHQVLIDSLAAYLAGQEGDPAAGHVAQLIDAHRADIFDDSATPVGGNPDGSVTLVEFFDYNCPYCRRMAPVLAEIQHTDRDVRILYKEWPILGAESEYAAKAALAAARQGKYLELHDAMMQAEERFDEAAVLRLAAELGIDIDRLQRDIADPAIAAAIIRNMQLAQSLGITGTPAFVIGDQLLRGAADATTMQHFLREARTKQSAARSADQRRAD